MLKKMLRKLRPASPRLAAPLPLVLYTRTGCHLCDEAREVLRDFVAREEVALEVVDIDSKPELVAEYGDKVPVIALDDRPRLWGKINEIMLRRLIEHASVAAGFTPAADLNQEEEPR